MLKIRHSVKIVTWQHLLLVKSTIFLDSLDSGERDPFLVGMDHLFMQVMFNR